MSKTGQWLTPNNRLQVSGVVALRLTAVPITSLEVNLEWVDKHSEHMIGENITPRCWHPCNVGGAAQTFDAGSCYDVQSSAGAEAPQYITDCELTDPSSAAVGDAWRQAASRCTTPTKWLPGGLSEQVRGSQDFELWTQCCSACLHPWAWSYRVHITANEGLAASCLVLRGTCSVE